MEASERIGLTHNIPLPVLGPRGQVYDHTTVNRVEPPCGSGAKLRHHPTAIQLHLGVDHATQRRVRATGIEQQRERRAVHLPL